MRWPIALHEASHAVTAIDVGFRVTKVTVKPDGIVEGRCWFEFDPQRVEDNLMVTLAGEWLPRWALAPFAVPSSADSRWLSGYPPHEVRAARMRLSCRRDRLWPRVTKLAAVLVGRETMYGTEIGECLR